MNIEISRRGFLKGAAVATGATALGSLGFGEAEAAFAAYVRPFKLATTTETRNTCPYCSVSCGVLIYSMGDKSKNAKASVIHIEGDPDHPVNRGTLCPRGAAALDFVKSPMRLKYPMHRKPGSDKFERVTWDFALDRIAALMKEDRDKNFIAKNKDGVTVNRWNTTGFLASSAASNEAGYLTHKVLRGLGVVTLDTQARI